MDFFDQLEELNRPTVHKKPWMDAVELTLATTEMLAQIEAEIMAAGRTSCDLETTGLDQRAFPADNGKLVTVDKIVGVCLACDKKQAYYLPIRHKEDGASSNIPPRLVMAMIKRLREAGVVFIFHNFKFDGKFLKHDPAGETGDWDDPKGWECTLTLAYLRNPRARAKGLKFLSKTELNREMIELDQLFLVEKGKKPKKDFSLLEPTWPPTVWYAAADALNTLELFDLLHPIVMLKDKHNRSQKTVYMIEKLCTIATIWMEQCRIYIDRTKLTKLIQLGQKEWFDCIESVYAAVSSALGRNTRPGWVELMHENFDPDVLSPDYMEVRERAKASSPKEARPVITKSVPSLVNPKVRETIKFPHSYDVTIPAEFGKMLRELGVKGLEATEKSGQVKTSKDVIERVLANAGEQFPWMKKVRRFREVTKALGNVLSNLYRDTEPSRSPDGRVWANFNGTKVDTGRFSTPTPRNKKEFFGQVNWNVQSTKAYYYNPKDPPPECVYRQREVIAAEGGYVMFAIDYSGVELRIVTNISGEPKWLAEFFHCSACDNNFEKGVLPPPFCPECGSDKIGDLHTLTTMNLFGINPSDDPKMFKLKRQVGKIVNFLLCYGGTGTAVMRSTGCDKEEGWRIKSQFDKTYKGLLRWWKSQHKVAKVQEYVTTAFGRKYPVPDIKHEFAKFRSKAERNAVNGPVQGTSADIMKLAMGLLYREFKKRGWICRGKGLPDLAKMVITIHDELVFELHKSIIKDALPVIEDIMCVKTVQNLGWVIPLKVDIEFSDNWTVQNNLTEMAHNKGGGDWTPDHVKTFPNHYANYLQCGGKPIDVDAAPPEGPQLHSALEPPTGGATPPPKTPSPASQAARPAAPGNGAAGAGRALVDPVRDGEDFIFQISSRELNPDSAQRLARVIHQCKGRGVDLLKIQDERGHDLIGEGIRVAWEEFRVLASYEGF